VWQPAKLASPGSQCCVQGLASVGSIPQPVESHAHCFRSLLFHGVVGNTIGCVIAILWRCGSIVRAKRMGIVKRALKHRCVYFHAFNLRSTLLRYWLEECIEVEKVFLQHDISIFRWVICPSLRIGSWFDRVAIYFLGAKKRARPVGIFRTLNGNNLK